MFAMAFSPVTSRIRNESSINNSFWYRDVATLKNISQEVPKALQAIEMDSPKFLLHQFEKNSSFSSISIGNALFRPEVIRLRHSFRVSLNIEFKSTWAS